jgi:phosphate uptake regulator
MSGRIGVRPTLPQDVNRQFLAAKRAVRDRGDVTAVQAEIATEVLAVLYYRRLLSRDRARALTPAGLQAVAVLVDPEATEISEVVGTGLPSRAAGLLGLRPQQTLAHAG